MQIIEKCAAYIVPAVLLVCAFLMVKTKGGGKVFVSGAAGGLRCAASLIPTMVMLCVGLSMLCASGGGAFRKACFPGDGAFRHTCGYIAAYTDKTRFRLRIDRRVCKALGGMRPGQRRRGLRLYNHGLV